MYRIRKAAEGDHGRLTELSFASKRYWSYPEHYYALWEPELTVTRGYLQKNSVYLIEKQDVIVAYYSLVLLEDDLVLQGLRLNRGYWLDHMFVSPGYIGRGLGSKLFLHLCSTCRRKKIAGFSLLADPFAKGFYEKMGCVFITDYPSSIKGRTTPLLKMEIF